MAEQPKVAEGFGRRVSERREALLLTQEQLADYVGVANTAVSEWENGKRLPRDPDNLVALATRLGCSIDYLLMDIEGQHEFITRRLRDLLEDLNRMRGGVMRPAQAMPQLAGKRDTAVTAAEADLIPDTRVGRRRRRGA